MVETCVIMWLEDDSWITLRSENLLFSLKESSFENKILDSFLRYRDDFAKTFYPRFI